MHSSDTPYNFSFPSHTEQLKADLVHPDSTQDTEDTCQSIHLSLVYILHTLFTYISILLLVLGIESLKLGQIRQCTLFYDININLQCKMDCKLKSSRIFDGMKYVTYKKAFQNTCPI